MKKFYILQLIIAVLIPSVKAQNILSPGKMPDQQKHGIQHRENYLKLNTTVFRYDTLITYSTSGPQNRFLYQYDYQGNPLTETIEIFSNSTWIYQSKYIDTYDGSGRLIYETEFYWESGSWKNSSRYSWQYDNNGNDTTEILEYWYNSSWNKSEKKKFTYNAEDSVTSILTQHWVQPTWENDYLEIFTYDAYGNNTCDLLQTWEYPGIWTNEYQTIYTYNGSGKVLTRTNQSWYNNTWENTYRDTYTYYSSGLLKTSLFDQWDNTWVHLFKGTYSYDNQGNQFLIIIQIWAYGAWYDYMRTNRVFDNDHNMLYEQNEMMNGGWENFDIYLYSYDENSNSVSGEYKIWNNNAFQPDNGYLYVFSQQNVINYFWDIYRYHAHFISYVVGTTEPKEDLFQIYPNPVQAGSVVHVKGLPSNEVVSLYDMYGKVLLVQKTGNGSIDIHIGSLARGCYFLTSGKQTKKILVD